MGTAGARRRSSPQGWPVSSLETVGECPVCGSTRRNLLYEKLTDKVFSIAPGRWKLYRCLDCGSGYLDPRPDAKSIGFAYASYYTHTDPLPTALERPKPIFLGGLRFALRNGYLNQRYGYSIKPSLRIGYLLARLLPLQSVLEDRLVRHLVRPNSHPRLLDVGCGNGTFLKTMVNLGWEVQGLDPDPDAIDVARRKNLSVRQGTLLNTQYPEASFDAVTLSHVVEHLHDPVANLRICFRLLRPGGLVWIATPNLSSRGHSTFQRDWRGLEPPRHLVLFTPAALRSVLQTVGFVAIRQPTVLRANWFYQVSNAIRLGNDPRDQSSLSFQMRFRAWLADILTLVQTERAEELVLMARKPPNE